MRRYSILITVLLAVAANAKTIKVSVPLSGRPWSMYAPGAMDAQSAAQSTVAGFNIALEYINKEIFPLTIDGTLYKRMATVIIEDSYDPDTAKGIVSRWMEPGKADLFISPYTTLAESSYAITDLYESNQRIVLSHYTTDSSYSAPPREWTFSLPTPADRYMLGTVPILKTAGAKTAVYVTSDDADCSTELTTALEANGISVVQSIDIPALSRDEPLSTDLRRHLKAIVETLRSTDIDVWYVCSENPRVAKYLRDTMYELKYSIKSMISSRCTDRWTDLEGYDHTKWQMTCINSTSIDTVDSRFGTFDRFLGLFRKHSPLGTYDRTVHSAAMALVIYAELLSRAGTKNHEVLREHLLEYSTVSYYGQISWNRSTHMQENTGIVMQYSIEGELELISPASSVQYVYPELDWNARLHSKKYRTVDIIFITLSVLIIALCIPGAVFAVLKRKSSALDDYSPSSICMSFAGTALLCSHVITKSLREADSVAACWIGDTLIAAGCSLMTVPLVTKALLVIRSHMHASNDIKASDTVVRYVSQAGLVIAAILAIIGTGIDPETVSAIENNSLYYECSFTNIHTIIVWTLQILYFLILLVGLACSLYLLLRVSTDDYEDSKTLSVSILSIVLYTVLVSVICRLSILYITRHVLYCSLVLLGAVTVTAVHTIPRFYAMIPKKMPNAVPVTAEEYEIVAND